MATGAVRNALKVFVGNLPWTIGNIELREFGQRFGPVSNVSVVFDKSTGFNKGYGFISFGTREGYENSIKSGTHHLEGNFINIGPTVSLD